MDELFSLPDPVEPEPNPCIAAFGKGPEGARCKSCELLTVKDWGTRYFKCDLRRKSNCTATDHRANWKACGRYIATDEPL
jgi:hypothetical protein